MPAPAADAVAVLVFVLLGRGSHREGGLLVGTAATAAPFLGGAAVGWLVLMTLRRAGRGWPGRALPAGATVLTATVVVGMALRRLAGGGTPVSFLVVATCFLALFLLGWRAVARWRCGPAGAGAPR